MSEPAEASAPTPPEPKTRLRTRLWRGLRLLLLLFAATIAVGESRGAEIRRGAAGMEIALAPPPRDLAGLEDPGAWREASASDRAAYATWLGRGLEIRRAAVLRATKAQAVERARRTDQTLRNLFRVVAALALLLSFVPLRLWRSEDGVMPSLLQRLLAGILLALLLLALGSLVRLLTEVTSEASASLDPQAAAADVLFDLIEARLEALGEDTRAESAIPLGPAVGPLGLSQDEAAIAQLVKNLQYLDLEALTPLYQSVVVTYHVFGWLPAVAPVLITLLFLLTVGFILQEIARMPGRVAAGTPRAIRSALGLSVRTLWRELLAVLLLTVLVGVFIIQVQLVVRLLAYVTVHDLVDRLEGTLGVLGSLDRAPGTGETWALGASLLMAPFAMFLALLATALGLFLFLARARRITQQRFHRKVPLRSHDRFWRRGGRQAITAVWAPALCLWVAYKITTRRVRFLEAEGEASIFELLGSALLMAALFVGGLWFMRVLPSLRDLLRGLRANR